jgi:hypothetical protein
MLQYSVVVPHETVWIEEYKESTTFSVMPFVYSETPVSQNPTIIFWTWCSV